MNTRKPSAIECVHGDCQMVKRCFAYDAMKEILDEDPQYVGNCYAFIPPKGDDEPRVVKIKRKRKLNDE